MSLRPAIAFAVRDRIHETLLARTCSLRSTVKRSLGVDSFDTVSNTNSTTCLMPGRELDLLVVTFCGGCGQGTCRGQPIRACDAPLLPKSHTCSDIRLQEVRRLSTIVCVIGSRYHLTSLLYSVCPLRPITPYSQGRSACLSYGNGWCWVG
jgi:hypothetical protein